MSPIHALSLQTRCQASDVPPQRTVAVLSLRSMEAPVMAGRSAHPSAISTKQPGTLVANSTVKDVTLRLRQVKRLSLLYIFIRIKVIWLITLICS